MVESDVLKFGDFTLKSGRKSPFFMNAGAYVTGDQLHRLGLYYAQAIHDAFGLDFDVVFGPAYKGIPLSVVTAMGISELYGKQVRYCSNRKEAKDHGDAGILLGSHAARRRPRGHGRGRHHVGQVHRGDVSHHHGACQRSGRRPHGVAQPHGSGQGRAKCALDEVADLYGFPTAAIVTMAEVTEHLHNRECQGRVVIDDATKAAIDAYYEQYGAKE